MKHIILVFMAFCVSILCVAQQKSAKVTLKNGKSFSGVVVEFNPATRVVLSIAGFDAKFDMEDVVSVEEIATIRQEETDLSSEQVIVEDTSKYPETYTLNVGPYEVEMRLIKGGVFSMGYEGRGSLGMDSEPVHQVALHSYYVNSKPLSNDLVSYLKSGKEKHSKNIRAYNTQSYKEIEDITNRLSEQSGISVKLITEAQWEYAATRLDDLFENNERNFCRDFYAPYESNQVMQVDPQGPTKGSVHVCRLFASFPTMYSRMTLRASTVPNPFAIRVSIPANALFKD